LSRNPTENRFTLFRVALYHRGAMSNEILAVSEMYAADRFASAHGTPTLSLMENAGRTVTDEIVRRWTPRPVLVLCGPGNNGGDGLVVARLLKDRGWEVRVALAGDRAAFEGDAAVNAARWTGETMPLSPAALEGCGLVVDALFGAGLARPLEGAAMETVCALLNEAHRPTVAIDVPSGLHGDTAKPLGSACVAADLTVTFFRKKPAHVLMLGRMFCGEVVVTQIGIPEAALDEIKPRIFENTPELWRADFPRPDPLGHKYSRGHVLVVSGPAHATGAARLAARGALRVGAGLVSVASPPDAVAANANHLTAIMVKPFEGPEGLRALLADKRFNTCVIGPGCGVGAATRELVYAALECICVLDADALTSFREYPKDLFDRFRKDAMLTPHEGEFKRLFPDLLERSVNRIVAAREAAKTAGCVVLLKGPDTAIAAPDGRVAVCTNAPPYLATAGAGDVLAGFIAGLLAQGMPVWEAACAAAWLHGEAAKTFGPGLIAEDLPEQLPVLLRRLHEG
jgi:ADP-dependent NAD(P)H-hydrate dehydratase / NAD(P)H-hydrate epimerase